MKTYTVQTGDSISKIARDVLGDISRWPEIAQLNNLQPMESLVATPYPLYLIFPGQTLKLPDAASSAPAQDQWVYDPKSGTTNTPDNSVPKKTEAGGFPWGGMMIGAALITLAVIAAREYKKRKRKTVKS